MKSVFSSFFTATLAICILAGTSLAQVRNSPLRPATIKREDPKKSDLVKEEGAVYLEEILNREIEVTISKAAPAYTNLTGERWIGTLIPNQKAVLLAVSEKAYRVRARAQQGQIAGWISKAAVDGLEPDFDENAKNYYQRYQLVSDLISKNQVAMGMTVEEVCASIGEPNKRSSKVDKEGRKDILEFITYDRIPQTTVARDQFGQLFQTVTYIQVETGRVTIEFQNDMVASIEESEGTNLAQGGIQIVPPPIFLY